MAKNRSHPSISKNLPGESNAIRFLNKLIVQPVGKKLLEEKDYQGLKLSSV